MFAWSMHILWSTSSVNNRRVLGRTLIRRDFLVTRKRRDNHGRSLALCPALFHSLFCSDIVSCVQADDIEHAQEHELHFLRSKWRDTLQRVLSPLFVFFPSSAQAALTAFLSGIRRTLSTQKCTDLNGMSLIDFEHWYAGQVTIFHGSFQQLTRSLSHRATLWRESLAIQLLTLHLGRCARRELCIQIHQVCHTGEIILGCRVREEMNTSTSYSQIACKMDLTCVCMD